ncbi:hypothetical protein [uncultured Serinicoccus sp.]|uniref:hypothetical protein n=1 Tax=uncultured Serinicoccus sp. TaxID=735514 RepID=UPI00261E50F4|nr:hypothetical protein [uncultured Serinicoccus sp.]
MSRPRPLSSARRVLRRVVRRRGPAPRTPGRPGGPVVTDGPGRGPARTPVPAAPPARPDHAPAVEARLGSRGPTLSERVVTSVRQLLGEARVGEAVATGYALLADPVGRPLGHLVLGIARRSVSDAEIAWQDLSQVGQAELAALAAEDWFVPAFEFDPQVAGDMLRRVLDEQRHREWTGTQLLLVARAAFAAQDGEAVRAVVASVTAGETPHVAASRRHELLDLLEWLPGGRYRAATPTLESTVRIGLMNYRAPGPGSRNVGDWIQTLASTGHLVRHANLSYVADDPELLRLVQDLAAGVRSERVLHDTPRATVQVVEVHRDGMALQDLPQPTWVPTFGWFLHPVTGQDHLFPFADAVRPIFISFHVNKPDMLTPAAIDYLRRYGPVGCRDWQTVALLQAVDVPAFFSGCMTTTVDTVVPPGPAEDRTEVAHIDVPGGSDDAVVEQSITGLRSLSFAQNLELARQWVDDYARRYHTVRTSRLHSNLPSRSVGCTVEFTPKNRSDVRFGGLIDIDDEAFEAIRRGILDKLAAMMGLVLAGAHEDEVYARWQEVCAADVEVARTTLGAMHLDLAEPVPVPGWPGAAQHVVVVDLGPGEAAHLPGLLRALADRLPPASCILVSGDETLQAGPLPEVGVPVTLVNRTTAELAELGEHGARLRDSTMRREVLLALAVQSAPDARRVVVLPAAVLLPDDLSALFDVDLGGMPVAAPADPRRGRRQLAGLIRSLSSRQGDDAAGALELVAAASRDADVLRVPFDPVVLVADPAALRAAGLERVVPLMLRYGATFREALNIVLGGRWTVLSTRWATAAHLQTPSADAEVVTYRVGARPWSDLVTARQEAWHAQQPTVR